MFANIIIDVPIRTLFTYCIPDTIKDCELTPGMRVLVPFGRKTVVGVFYGFAGSSGVSEDKLKDIIQIIDDKPLVSELYLQWLRFASEYYCAPMGQVVAQAFPSYWLDAKHKDKTALPRAKEVAFAPVFEGKSVQLTPEQQSVCEAIDGHCDEFAPVLLQGITGSGKTEVYIELIKKALERRRSALFLVPEIGLTPQMMARLHHHFHGRLLLYHSGLTVNQRAVQWYRCLDDKPQVMVGTRSALFAPFQNLGLVVVDEEHDGSYKQEDRFRYHARDLAVRRAQLLKIPIVLGSATPSLESYYQAKEGKYHFFQLKERASGARLPQMAVIDFGKEKEQTSSHQVLSRAIHKEIAACLQSKEQAMIFVGQRGFAKNAYCVACQTIQLCPNCSVGLTYHKHRQELKCHYCEFTAVFDEECSSCHEKAVTLLGFGTQTVEDELLTMHPGLRLARLDRDVVTTPAKFHSIIQEFSEHKLDVLVGTQMITKGHDFAKVSFVGVLGIDAHLGLPDFRATERSFQSLVQVAGRAGRGDVPGRVLIQSFMPGHMSIQLGLEQDYLKFAQAELKHREETGFAPFSRLVQFKFLSNHQNRLESFLNSWSQKLRKNLTTYKEQDIQMLGPSEMPLAKVRGKHRYHILFKLRRGLKAQGFADYVMKDFEGLSPAGISMQVDVDPVGLL